MRNNLQNLAFVCLPVGANTEREDRGIERLGSRSTCNRTADIVVKPQVGHIAREGQTAKILAGVHGQTPEVGIGRVLGNGTFAVAVAATDRESSTDASAFTEAEVNAEHAAVNIGAVAGVAIERIGFVGAVEDISPNTEALLGIQITLDQRVGNQFHRVVGHVVGTGRNRSNHVFLSCTDTVARQLAVFVHEPRRRATDCCQYLLVVKVCTFGKYASESALQPCVGRHIIVDGHNQIRMIGCSCFRISCNVLELHVQESIRRLEHMIKGTRNFVRTINQRDILHRVEIGKIAFALKIKGNVTGIKNHISRREGTHINNGDNVATDGNTALSLTNITNLDVTGVSNTNGLVHIETIKGFCAFAELAVVNSTA